MRFTSQLRAEHDLLIGMSDALRAAALRGAPAEVPRLAVLLGQFTQLLQVHLLREDSVLYPALEASRDASVAEAVAALRQDHGILARQVEAFERAWCPEEIRRRRPAFTAELLILLDTLHLRIERENEGLYPMLERPAAAAA